MVISIIHPINDFNYEDFCVQNDNLNRKLGQIT